jgi:hypothetical protein
MFAAHNTPLQVLAEMGLRRFVLFALILVPVIQTLWRINRRQTTGYATVAVGSLLVLAFVQGSSRPWLWMSAVAGAASWATSAPRVWLNPPVARVPSAETEING